MKNDFKIGDKVKINKKVLLNECDEAGGFIGYHGGFIKCIKESSSDITGKIVSLELGNETNSIGVEFDYKFPFVVYNNIKKVFPDNKGQFCRPEHLIKIEDNNFNNGVSMNLVENFKSLFVKEPQKSFRKLGITDNSDILTEDGKTLFLTWLFNKHSDDFKKEVVDVLLKEQ